MSGKTFRDIFTEILEEKSSQKGHSQTQQTTHAPGFASQMAEIPFVFFDFKTPPPSRAASVYPRSATPKQCSTQPKVSSVSRDSLSSEGQTALDTLLGLGALELQETLSLEVIKRAYRRLLKFYHPDHNPLGLNPEEQTRRVEQFWILRKAYPVLEAEIKKGLQGALSHNQAA